MGDQDFKIEEVFESAVSIVRNLPKEGSIKPSDGLKLKLYALFKQATHGPNDTPKPRFYQFVDGYKWEAWRRLGDLSKEEAMERYIGELKQVMETIPADEAVAEDNKYFEEILGKKFYDYWFNEWNNQKSQELTVSSTRSSHPLVASTGGSSVSVYAEGGAPSSSHMEGTRMSATTQANDTHSSSSDNSSLSMLEDTQSPEGDGYKTPNSLMNQCNITGHMSDQFALAVLRLQHGLDETNSRVNRIEAQMTRTVESVQSLENQTHAKRPIASCGCEHQCSSSRERRSGCGGRKIVNLLSRIDSLHWFYLGYPLVVYALLRAFERRRRSQIER